MTATTYSAISVGLPQPLELPQVKASRKAIPKMAMVMPPPQSGVFFLPCSMAGVLMVGIMANTRIMAMALMTVRNRNTILQLILSTKKPARMGASIMATPMPAPLMVMNMGRSFSLLISPISVR